MKKQRLSPIASWSIWAVGLLLGTGIVTRQHLLVGFRTDNTGMCYVIAAISLVGMAMSLLAALKLQSEWSVLRKVTASGALPATASKSGLVAVFKKLEGYKATGEAVDAFAVIDSYHAQHNSRVRSVSILAALVISMGLLGTVVGLIMSISGLGNMVENIGLSRNTMMEALKATVAGMGTAFYTTYYGAMAGMVLRAVAGSQLNALSELCAEAAEYAATHLATKSASQEERLDQQMAKVVASFENMQKQIDTLTLRIADGVEISMAKLGESIGAAGKHAMEATQGCIQGMTAEMNRFNGEVGASFGTFRQSVEKAGEEVRSAIGWVNSSIAQSGEALNGAFGGLNATINKAGEDVGTSFASLNESVAQAGDAVSGSLADFKLSVDGTSLELKEAVGELHGAISQATGEMVTMAKAKLDTDAV